MMQSSYTALDDDHVASCFCLTMAATRNLLRVIAFLNVGFGILMIALGILVDKLPDALPLKNPDDVRVVETIVIGQGIAILLSCVLTQRYAGTTSVGKLYFVAGALSMVLLLQMGITIMVYWFLLVIINTARAGISNCEVCKQPYDDIHIILRHITPALIISGFVCLFMGIQLCVVLSIKSHYLKKLYREKRRLLDRAFNYTPSHRQDYPIARSCLEKSIVLTPLNAGFTSTPMVVLQEATTPSGFSNRLISEYQTPTFLMYYEEELGWESIKHRQSVHSQVAGDGKGQCKQSNAIGFSASTAGSRLAVPKHARTVHGICSSVKSLKSDRTASFTKDVQRISSVTPKIDVVYVGDSGQKGSISVTPKNPTTKIRVKSANTMTKGEYLEIPKIMRTKSTGNVNNQEHHGTIHIPSITKKAIDQRKLVKGTETAKGRSLSVVGNNTTVQYLIAPKLLRAKSADALGKRIHIPKAHQSKCKKDRKPSRARSCAGYTDMNQDVLDVSCEDNTFSKSSKYEKQSTPRRHVSAKILNSSVKKSEASLKRNVVKGLTTIKVNGIYKDDAPDIHTKSLPSLGYVPLKNGKGNAVRIGSDSTNASVVRWKSGVRKDGDTPSLRIKRSDVNGVSDVGNGSGVRKKSNVRNGSNIRKRCSVTKPSSVRKKSDARSSKKRIRCASLRAHSLRVPSGSGPRGSRRSSKIQDSTLMPSLSDKNCDVGNLSINTDLDSSVFMPS